MPEPVEYALSAAGFMLGTYLVLISRERFWRIQSGASWLWVFFMLYMVLSSWGVLLAEPNRKFAIALGLIYLVAVMSFRQPEWDESS